MNADERLGDALRTLSSDSIPALGGELEAELASLEPRRPRRPRRSWAALTVISLVYCGLLVLLTGFRRDLAELPTLWLAGFSAAWLVCAAALAWIATVPRAGHVMPRWRAAGLSGGLAALGFILAGLLFHETAPGVSTEYDPSPATVLRYSKACTALGLLTALVPVTYGALLLRGALPVGSRWAAAGLGAAGGSLGGLMLHWHCPVTERFHVGLVHGGVILVCALLAALILPRATDR